MRNFCFRRYTLAALLVGAVGLTSCNLVFEEGKSNPTDGPLVDGLAPNMRISKPFTMPVDTSVNGGDPSLTFNETELWSVGGNPYDLQVAKATGGTPLWANDSVAVGTLNDALKNDIEPALTANGLLLTFATNRSGSYQMYFSTRATTAAFFSPPKLSTLQFPNSFFGFDMSPDGLKIYIIDGSMLRVMKRTSQTGDFMAEKTIGLPVANAGYPTVSFDELEIIYNDKDSATLVHATLAADKSRYEKPKSLQVGETCASVLKDADFSADAMTVVYNCNGSIHIARRQ